MSCEQRIQVGDITTTLEVELLENCDAALDVSTSSVRQITVVRPDKTNFVRTAILTTDGTDGKIYILTVLGDLTLSGTYHIQAYLELPAWQGHSGIGEFDVFDNLA